MKRYAHNKDSNHRAVVDAFKRAGCSVTNLESSSKAGVPDLAIGCCGRTLLVEIKPDSHLARHKPSKAQQDFASSWRGGPVHLVRSPEQAWELAALIRASSVVESKAAALLANAAGIAGKASPCDVPTPDVETRGVGK